MDAIRRSNAGERSPVIERAASILFAFSIAEPELTLGELSKRTGLPPSTARRLLTQLIEANLVQQDPATQRYGLSLRLVQLSAVALQTEGMVSQSNPVLRELMEETGETAFLGQLGGQGVMYLAVVEPRTAVRISTHAGETRLAHVTSIGKALLAELSEAELDDWLATHPLDPIGPNVHTSADSLKADLAEIRQRGYAINYRESSPDFASVAAPVRDHHQRAVAAVAIAGPAYRTPVENLPGMGRTVMAAAQRISRQLGGSIVAS